MLSSSTMIPLKTMHAYLPDTQLRGTPLLVTAGGLLICKAVCVLIFSLLKKIYFSTNGPCPSSGAGETGLGRAVGLAQGLLYATMGNCKERALLGLKVMCCVMCEARTRGRAAANESWQTTAQKLVSCSAVSKMSLEGTGRAGLSHFSILIKLLHCRQKSDVVSKLVKPIEAHFKMYWNKTGLLSCTAFFWTVPNPISIVLCTAAGKSCLNHSCSFS